MNERDLLMALRAYAAAQGVTDLIVLGDLPTTPDRALGLGLYDTDDEIEISRSTVRVQFMCRGKVGDSMDAADLADDLFDIFEALTGLWTPAGQHVADCYRISRVPLGIDADKRSALADNYELLVDTPLTARRPA